MKEYVKDSGFLPYMGTGTEGLQKPITVATENKKGGETTKIPILIRLTGRGVSGNVTLSGAEEAMNRQQFVSRVDYRRHAVLTSEWDEHKAFAKSYDEARPLLKQWCEEQVRDNIIDAMSMVVEDSTRYRTYAPPISNPTTADAASKIFQASTTAQNNTWLTDNTDRIVFGNDGVGATTNLVAGNFAGSLANLDAGVNDKPTSTMVSVMKYKAKVTANPHIRPVRVNNGQGRQYFVLFCDSRTFMYLKTDTNIVAANRDARPRTVEENPLFQDGDLMWDGVLIREIPELLPIPAATYSTTGVDIGRMYLVGAQAICFSWGMEPDFRKNDVTDYGKNMGVGVTEVRGCQKIQTIATVGGSRVFDLGMVSGFPGLPV